MARTIDRWSVPTQPDPAPSRARVALVVFVAVVVGGIAAIGLIDLLLP